MANEEFNPMLAAGIHDIKKEDMRDFFTKPFENKERRNNLIDKFQALLDRVHELEIEFEVWIDGSFTTLKEAPNDIDALFILNQVALNNLPPEKQQVLQELSNNALTKAKYNCDIYFAGNNDQAMRSYWRGWFGFSRSEQAKGIARIV